MVEISQKIHFGRTIISIYLHLFKFKLKKNLLSIWTQKTTNNKKIPKNYKIDRNFEVNVFKKRRANL